MNKIAAGLMLLMSLSAFADDSFQLRISSVSDSHLDIYSNMANMYARSLSGIVDGKEQLVMLICMVDPELSDAYKDKLLPGALIDCGIGIDGGVHPFDASINVDQLIKDIDSSKGLKTTVSLKNEVSMRLW